MGSVLFVACTNVGESMIEAVMHTPSLKSWICGIVNLDLRQGAGKANYQTYAGVSQKYSIPIHYCDNVNDAATLGWIRDKSPDLIVQTGWSQKFGEELLSLPTYGCIGEHPAPLPKGRGAACVNWAILTGERTWGDTFFEMVSQYDKGSLLAQELFTIEEYDTVKTVYDKVAKSSAKMIVRELDNWTSGRFNKLAQDDSLSTYYKRRRPEDGLFDFSLGAKEIHDFVRAQTYPYPGAFIKVGDDKLSILSAEYLHQKADAKAGTVITADKGCVCVVCGDGGVLKISRVKLNDEPECWAEEYIKQSSIKNLM